MPSSKSRGLPRSRTCRVPATNRLADSANTPYPEKSALVTSKIPGRIHEFEIIHDWGDPVTLSFDGTGFQSVKTCLDCGGEQRALHLRTYEKGKGDGQHGSWEDEEALQNAAASFRRLGVALEQYVQDLLCDTEFDGLDQVRSLLSERYERRIGDQDMTLRLIRYFTRSKTWKQKRKVILALKQGLVCNRCDSTAPSLDDLTEDHIIPRQHGGQSKLDNLQLLCGRCNENKADGLPSDKDCSPFGTPTELCLHRMTCREINALSAPEGTST